MLTIDMLAVVRAVLHACCFFSALLFACIAQGTAVPHFSYSHCPVALALISFACAAVLLAAVSAA
jgi:hypothetical protein